MRLEAELVVVVGRRERRRLDSCPPSIGPVIEDSRRVNEPTHISCPRTDVATEPPAELSVDESARFSSHHIDRTELAIGIGANFILGAIMTAGIGLYAPCMALVFALGMSPAVAFPIMMGSCATLMPLAAYRFIKEGAFNRRASYIISITGLIAVLIAAFLVKSLPLDVLRWLVIVVIIYTASVMLRAGLKSK